MKKTRIFLSYICALFIMLASVSVPNVMTVSAVDYNSTLTEIYPVDFGLNDDVYSSNISAKYLNGESLLNTIFTMLTENGHTKM